MNVELLNIQTFLETNDNKTGSDEIGMVILGDKTQSSLTIYGICL